MSRRTPRARAPRIASSSSSRQRRRRRAARRRDATATTAATRSATSRDRCRCSCPDAAPPRPRRASRRSADDPRRRGAARRLRPHGGGVARQGLGDRPLGADGPRPRPAVSGVSRRVSRRGDRRSSSAASAARTLGNKAASGTAIIDELGPEHMRTGTPIVYTSADSVFQIAAHEDVDPGRPSCIEFCEIAYELVGDGLGVGRVIARPFVGAPGAFTADREPPRLRADAVRADAARSPDRQRACRSSPSARSRISSPAAASHAPSTRRATTTGWTRSSARCDHDRRGLIFANLVDFDTRVRPPQRPGRLRGQPRAVRRAARAAAAAPRPTRSARRHRRSRQRSDDAEHRPLARARAAVRRRRRRVRRGRRSRGRARRSPTSARRSPSCSASVRWRTARAFSGTMTSSK